MNTRLPLLLPASLLLLCPVLLGAAEKFLLRPHWEPGKVSRYESQSVAEVRNAGATVPQTTSITQQLEVSVSRQSGSDRKLADMRLTAIKATVNTDGMLLNYDSADPAQSSPMLQQVFGALAGKNVALLHDKDDKFIEVSVPADFKMTPLGAGQGPDGRQFGEMLRQSLVMGLPEAPLSAGESYTQENKLTFQPLGEVSVTLRGKFTGVVQHEGRRHARLEIEGTMKVPANPNAPPAVLQQSRITGEILFDLERKAISKHEMRNESRLSVGGDEVALKTHSTTSLKAIEDSKAKAG